MSISSVSAQSSAYAYLQSLLPSGGVGAADPVTQLLDAFYPGGADGQSPSTSATGTSVTSPPSPTISPDTMASLISLQGQDGNSSVTDRAQSLFNQIDTNGDGQIDKSEFENVFGANADMSKVDGLFNVLDANGDGSISQNELTSAAQQSHAQHHHHHHASGAGQPGGQDGGLSSLMSALDPTGASTQTTSNSDGSSTTTITYADGSTVTMTTPVANSSGTQANDGGNSGTGDSNNSNNSGNSNNLLQQLIRLQAQFLTPSASQTLATV